MSKEEALEVLTEWALYGCEGEDDEEVMVNNAVEVIETALKDYELIKQAKIIVADKDVSDEDLEKLINQRMFVGSLEQCEIKPLFDEETQKKLKAFEIIKEKRVDVSYLVISDDLHDYNEGLDRKWKLTQEEYDLLKEYFNE